ncbi:MAG TPA: alanine dehydrogenase [Verrucomicrobiales bacterium]|nr:alanine dehydrogenase [Roseibacillus sp.]HCQ33394.1 alanine dehydrogenase [Verrucomicrobiales bacterium]
MKIGVPREVKPQEHRVGMVPASAGELVKHGHRVVIETGAGANSSYLDAEYQQAGVEILPSAEAVYGEAELIVKVKEPQPSEVTLLGPEHTLFAYLHLAADKSLTEALVSSGCTAIAYETLEVGGRLPLLEPMSELAGRMAAIFGSYHLANHRGGRGILLGGVPGVAPGRVMVIGGGTAGVNAARVATGIGADVTIVEVDVERMRFLDITLQEAHTLYSTEANISSLLPRVDLIIGAVLIPGAAAPKLITRDMLKQMAPGSVFVDIAIDQGGCSETSRPTDHDNPTYFDEDVLHYCVTNMPGAYSRTATQALNNVTTRWTALLAANDLQTACRNRPELLSAINCTGGKLTCPPVGEAHSLSTVSPAEVLELH